MQLSSACYAPVSLDHITNFRLCILHYRLTHPRSLSPTYPDLSNKLHQIFYKTFVGCHTRIHTFRSLEPVSIPQTSEFALFRILIFEYQVSGLVDLDFCIHMHAHVFGVHEEAWDCHGVCHALLHGRSVG
jgi:hypothetical protein